MLEVLVVVCVMWGEVSCVCIVRDVRLNLGVMDSVLLAIRELAERRGLEYHYLVVSS